MVTRMRYSPGELAVNVSNRIRTAERAQQRNMSLGGKLLNMMTTEYRDGVALSGQVIIQILEYVDKKPPTDIIRDREYLLTFNEARSFLSRLNARRKKDPDEAPH